MRIRTRTPNYCDFGPSKILEFSNYNEFIELDYIRRWISDDDFVGLYYDVLELDNIPKIIRLFTRLKPSVEIIDDKERITEYYWMAKFFDEETPKFLNIPLR